MPALYGLRSVHGRMKVASTAHSDLTIESATLTFRYKGSELAAARLMRPIEVPAGEVSKVRFDFAIENTSLASLQALQARMLTNPGQITVDVRGYVRWGRLRKKVGMEGIPVMDIISTFGPLQQSQ
jgi:hypothetical protein